MLLRPTSSAHVGDGYFLLAVFVEGVVTACHAQCALELSIPEVGGPSLPVFCLGFWGKTLILDADRAKKYDSPSAWRNEGPSPSFPADTGPPLGSNWLGCPLFFFYITGPFFQHIKSVLGNLQLIFRHLFAIVSFRQSGRWRWKSNLGSNGNWF